MDKILCALNKYQSCSFKVKYAFMHNNVSKLTREFFEHKRLAGEKIMEWPPLNPDLNPIKNLSSVVKMKFKESSKWTKSMDNKLLAVFEKKCHNMKM